MLKAKKMRKVRMASPTYKKRKEKKHYKLNHTGNSKNANFCDRKPYDKGMQGIR